MRTAPALLALVLALGVAGCGAGGDDARPEASPFATSPAESPDSTGSPSADPRAFLRIPRASDGGQGKGNGLGLTGVRTARHDGFDRIVFDLGGKGKPGWRVEYVRSPRADGSGDRVALKGKVFLQVVLRGMGYPDDTGVEVFGDASTRVSGAGTENVVEIAPGGVFEGTQQALVGLTAPKRPFRVFALTNPTRVVVDVEQD